MAGGQKMIKIYGNSHCFKCKKKIEELNKDNIPYEYINTETLKIEELKKIAEKAGSFSLPIIINE